MGAILEWAREWQGVITLVGTLLIAWYARETYLIRLVTITSGAPSVRLHIHYDETRPRFEVENIEGRIAYNVHLAGFDGEVEDPEVNGRLQPVRVTFEPLNYLLPGSSTGFHVIMESSDRTRDLTPRILEALWHATGFPARLLLRLRYEDGTGMQYVVRVTMPTRLESSMLDRQPICSTPHPMTTGGKILDRVFWPIAEALSRRAIKRDDLARKRSREERARKRAAAKQEEERRN